MANLSDIGLATIHRLDRASRYSAPENGADILPLPYGDLTLPTRTDSGVYRCPKIDTAGAGTYCVAGFQIDGTVSLFDDDGLIDAGDYTLNLSNDFQGQGVIATAVFSVAPNGNVTAICKGKEDSAGALIENPALIVEELMKNLWGFDDQDISALSKSIAESTADALGYKAAGMITADRSPAEVLTEIMSDFSGNWRISGNGRLEIYFLVDEGIEKIHPAVNLPADTPALVEMETTIDSIINQVPVFSAWNEASGEAILFEDGDAEKDSGSQGLYGVRIPEAGVRTLKWQRQSASVQSMQGLIVDHFKRPSRIIRIQDTTMRGILLQPGDYATFTVKWGLTEFLETLINQIGEVLSISFDLDSHACEYVLRDSGFFLTTANLLDGSETLGGGWLLGGERLLDRVA